MKKLLFLFFILVYSNSFSQSKKYYSIGATRDEVLNIQGEPDRISEFDAFKESVWYYESSSVTFKNGKVSEYSNTSKNLLIRLKKEKSKEIKNAANPNEETPKYTNWLNLTDKERKEAKDFGKSLSSFTGTGIGMGQGDNLYTEGLRELQKYDPNATYIAGVPIPKERIEEAKRKYYFNKSIPYLIGTIILIVLLLIISNIRKSSTAPKFKNDMSAKNLELEKVGGIQEKYKVLISRFDNFDIYNLPQIVENKPNHYELVWIGNSTIMNIRLFEVLDNLHILFKTNINEEGVRDSLSQPYRSYLHNTRGQELSKEEIESKINTLKAQISKKYEWKFPTTMSQNKMMEAIANKINELMES